jgi:xylan 1,4-beta-xylosidase
MIESSRRDLFKVALSGAAALPLAATATAASAATMAPACTPGSTLHWGHGIENQRIADLGNGTFLNPIVAGDHADPTILKDGTDYYMTFTSFSSYPGVVIWHSTDMVNWAPLKAALTKPIGVVFAVDLSKHDNRYYVYIPADPGTGWTIFVIWADHIEGPWSDPIDLKIPGCIDPCHVVGEDGKRYLFVNGVRRIRLTDDGLAADGPLEKAYEPWRYPEDWVVENFAPEGPKLHRHGEYFYLTTAVGGTAGPPTGHMVIAARSKSINGPWEHCPHNPLVRTQSASELWWSRGHASLVEGPAGDWWMVYHGYENSFRTLGRQTLLEPIEWTADGWFKAKGGDLSKPLAKPKGGKPSAAGMALSDDFKQSKIGLQWNFYAPAQDEMQRVHYEAGGLRLTARGHTPADSAPLTCVMGDRAYQAEIALEITGQAEGGLLLFYNHKAFVGVGATADTMKTYTSAEEQSWLRAPISTTNLRIRLTNIDNIVTWHTSQDGGKSWQLHPLRMEVSGINHNVFGEFLSLRIGLYAAGEGDVRLKDFTYRAM